jgi:hypothetical protein
MEYPLSNYRFLLVRFLLYPSAKRLRPTTLRAKPASGFIALDQPDTVGKFVRDGVTTALALSIQGGLMLPKWANAKQNRPEEGIIPPSSSLVLDSVPTLSEDRYQVLRNARR